MSAFNITLTCPNCQKQMTAPFSEVGKLGCETCDYSLDLAPIINSIGDMLDGVKNKGRKLDLHPGVEAISFPPGFDHEYAVGRLASDAPMEGLEEEKPKRAPQYLREAANVYEERNKVYGDSYKQFGIVMDGMFPNGLFVNTIEGYNRLGVFNMMLSKLVRYAANLSTGGHEDSARDLIVYSAMLQELTSEGNGG